MAKRLVGAINIDTEKLSALLQGAERATNSGVVLATMMLRDFFRPPSSPLTEQRLDDALRLYKSPMIARYALSRGGDANGHTDAFVDNARDGETELMLAMLEGGLHLGRKGTRLSSAGLCALYAAAHSGQPMSVALLLQKTVFNTQELESVTSGHPEASALIHALQVQPPVTRPETESTTGTLAPVSGAFNFSTIKSTALRLLPQKLFQNGAENSM